MPESFYTALAVYCSNPGFQAVPVLAGSTRRVPGSVAVPGITDGKTYYFGRILGPVFFGWPDLKDRSNRELLRYEVMHFSKPPVEKPHGKDRLDVAEEKALRDFLKAKKLS